MKKRTITLTTVLCLAVAICLSCAGCVPSKDIPTDTKWTYNPDEWAVTFEDNFDGTTLDTSKWLVGTMDKSDNIRRASYYTNDAENLFVSNGNLTIRTNYRTSDLGTGWHTSWVETATRESSQAGTPTEDYKGFSQKGGYFEIRCQAPPSKGIWSAFWLMPDEGVAFSENDKQGTATDGVEIDIMESPNYQKNSDAVCHVLHCDGYDSRLKSVNSGNYTVPNLYSEMHTYALEWTADTYRFYIDGYLTWETKHTIDNQLFGVSDVLQYLILSVEVGGHSENGELFAGIDANGSKSWAGNPDKNDKSKNYDFIIDYVKVMQKI